MRRGSSTCQRDSERSQQVTTLRKGDQHCRQEDQADLQAERTKSDPAGRAPGGDPEQRGGKQQSPEEQESTTGEAGCLPDRPRKRKECQTKHQRSGVDSQVNHRSARSGHVRQAQTGGNDCTGEPDSLRVLQPSLRMFHDRCSLGGEKEVS